jgi:hypothetical protein
MRIGLLADHPELRDESRELLLEAARVAQEGARFDDELIDRADRLVSRAEVRCRRLPARPFDRPFPGPELSDRHQARVLDRQRPR